MRVDWCVSSWFRIKNTHSHTKASSKERRETLAATKSHVPGIGGDAPDAASAEPLAQSHPLPEGFEPDRVADANCPRCSFPFREDWDDTEACALWAGRICCGVVQSSYQCLRCGAATISAPAPATRSTVADQPCNSLLGSDAPDQDARGCPPPVRPTWLDRDWSRATTHPQPAGDAQPPPSAPPSPPEPASPAGDVGATPPSPATPRPPCTRCFIARASSLEMRPEMTRREDGTASPTTPSNARSANGP